MENGLYGLRFSTPLGSGHGVAYLHDGKLHGGDATIAYVGSYSAKGNDAKADVRFFKHGPGESVMGVTQGSLSFTGNTDGQAATLVGSSPQAPGVKLSLHMKKLES